MSSENEYGSLAGVREADIPRFDAGGGLTEYSGLNSAVLERVRRAALLTGRKLKLIHQTLIMISD